MKQIEFSTLQGNPAHMIGQQWMLIAAGTPKNFNCMTASWGGLGFVWGKPVAFVMIRPNRYTHTFVEKEEGFTLSFLPEAYRRDLTFCGRNSGRDVDKIASTNLTPYTTPSGLIAMQDADVVLECRKLFRSRMQKSDFSDWSSVSPKWYDEDNPLHDLYICEITAAWTRG